MGHNEISTGLMVQYKVAPSYESLVTSNLELKKMGVHTPVDKPRQRPRTSIQRWFIQQKGEKNDEGTTTLKQTKKYLSKAM